MEDMGKQRILKAYQKFLLKKGVPKSTNVK